MGFDSSRGRESSSASVWGTQSPYLLDLYQRGQNLVRQFQPNAGIEQAWQAHLQPQQNPYLQQMTQTYRDQLGQLDNQAGMGAAGAGVYGGGRQGVEQYLNQRNVGNQVGQFLGNQYQQDMNRSLQAATMDRSGYGQRMGALQDYSSLVGLPAVLSESSGRRSSKGLQLM